VLLECFLVERETLESLNLYCYNVLALL